MVSRWISQFGTGWVIVCLLYIDKRKIEAFPCCPTLLHYLSNDEDEFHGGVSMARPDIRIIYLWKFVVGLFWFFAPEIVLSESLQPLQMVKPGLGVRRESLPPSPSSFIKFLLGFTGLVWELQRRRSRNQLMETWDSPPNSLKSWEEVHLP